MTTTLTADGVNLDRPTRRYVGKLMAALERLLPRRERGGATAGVLLRRVNRPHGNKYEVTVSLTVNGASFTEADSTLNVLAALDIVQAKLRAELRAHYS